MTRHWICKWKDFESAPLLPPEFGFALTAAGGTGRESEGWKIWAGGERPQQGCSQKPVEHPLFGVLPKTCRNLTQVTVQDATAAHESFTQELHCQMENVSREEKNHTGSTQTKYLKLINCKKKSNFLIVFLQQTQAQCVSPINTNWFSLHALKMTWAWFASAN